MGRLNLDNEGRRWSRLWFRVADRRAAVAVATFDLGPSIYLRHLRLANRAYKRAHEALARAHAEDDRQQTGREVAHG